MSPKRYDDVQKTFFEEPALYQSIDRQRLIAEARYVQSRELRRLVRIAAGAVAHAVKVAFRPLARFHQRSMLERQLRSLDDRTLKDVGIHRSDIPTIINTVYPWWKDEPSRTAVGATIHQLALAARAVRPPQANDHEGADHPLAA